ncbi:MAG: hypothetical protein AB8G86_22160 [Saprospiraceae bacterium]
MTEEEKYINQLFKAAKNEAPKRSFEEVATHFEKTIVTTPVATGWSKLYVKYFSLNTLLLAVIGSLGIAGFLWLTPTPITQSAPLTEKKAIPIIDKKIKKEEQSRTIQLPSNNNLVKKEAQPKEIIIPKEKKELKADLTNKKAPIKEGLSVAPPQKIAKSSPNTLAKTTTKKEAITTTSITPNPKEIATTPPTATNASVAIIDSISTVSKKIKLPSNKSELLQLKHTANEKEITTFLVRIRSYGFSLTEKMNRNSGKIERINLHISLFNGLDWKIKLRNFEVFELKILLDEYKNPVGLSYRLSETGKFSEVIALNSRARSTHKFSKKGDGTGSHSFTKSFTKHVIN